MKISIPFITLKPQFKSKHFLPKKKKKSLAGQNTACLKYFNKMYHNSLLNKELVLTLCKSACLLFYLMKLETL